MMEFQLGAGMKMFVTMMSGECTQMINLMIFFFEDEHEEIAEET
jgi:hypothetical protein